MNSSDRQQTIQLLVGEDGNRAAVRELLSEHYDVITDQSVTEADCYLVDDYTFPEHHSDLLERVEDAYPVFCPVVAIRREDSSLRLTLPDPGDREPPLLVNETVDAPIDPPVLFRRLDTLLTRRQQSLELRHYITRLKESNKSLEQFAYAASHDLQEPLRMISSYLQLIEQRYGNELDEEVDEFLDFAIDGANRMRGMIDGLLEYSRIDTEGGQLTETELNDVLEDVQADLQMKIDEHDAAITSDSLPRIEGDPDQLRQLFQNLLSNAIEYSGDEQPEVAVEAERSGTEWQISVTDDGIGIDPDDQERIFEVFQRLHSHDEYAGTGIGLALCKRIVKRHGGRIWVDSEPGEGSTFTFTLPAVDAPRG
ncbi:His Kinase A (phospho-acceptor) domain-containing protein [Natronorubrum sediminis]|uniref:histidine kinase n=1 Tax=Natronorubrum sediminis TaxID=640943 RepID=A0A1H6FTI8_9EURY|nr:ATP-binding protein [Natronorubrum sediminis]SEH13105.1 His Kinase A (phospho-acceptor) domain-containing protein [Natronorubrum sediminis]